MKCVDPCAKWEAGQPYSSILPSCLFLQSWNAFPRNVEDFAYLSFEGALSDVAPRSLTGDWSDHAMHHSRVSLGGSRLFLWHHEPETTSQAGVELRTPMRAKNKMFQQKKWNALSFSFEISMVFFTAININNFLHSSIHSVHRISKYINMTCESSKVRSERLAGPNCRPLLYCIFLSQRFLSTCRANTVSIARIMWWEQHQKNQRTFLIPFRYFHDFIKKSFAIGSCF